MRRKKLFYDYIARGPEGYSSFIRGAQIFRIQNVYDFFQQTWLPAHKRIRSDDFPVIAPPFPRMWFEYQIRAQQPAKRSLSGEQPDFDISGVGIAVDAEPFDEAADISFYPPDYDDCGKWILFVRFFVVLSDDSERPVKCPGSLAIPVRDDGSAYRNSDGGIFVAQVIQDIALQPVQSLAWSLLSSSMNMFLPVLLLSLSFLNCKNVIRVEQGGPGRLGESGCVLGNQKRRRKRRSLTRHYVLDVRPLRTLRVNQGDGNIGKSPRKQSLHICRGHFKVFGLDKPLFGRHVGMFWWSAHVRGAPEAGIVTKDYRLHPPEKSRVHGVVIGA